MKHNKQRFKASVSLLALLLTLSTGTIFHGPETEDMRTASPTPSLLAAQETKPAAISECTQTLTDLDGDKTKITEN